MRTLRKVSRSGLRAVRRLAALRKVRELEDCNHDLASPISKAIRATLKGDLTSDEASWIAKIEARRSDLLADHTVIEATDFGAGSPSTNRSLEQASAGLVFTTQVSNIAHASKGAVDCTLLFKLVRHLGPSNLVEMGTCVGISASYQAAALRLNGHGSLVTLEGSDATAEIAISTLFRLGLDQAEVHVGPFHNTLAHALETQEPVDFLFNDGHHDGKAVLRYFEQAVPHLAERAVLFVDDIRWSPSMTHSWRTLCEDPRFALSIDFGRTGLLVWDPQCGADHRFSFKL